MTKEIISIESLSKDFDINHNNTTILKNINFKLFQGDIISISGPSGSGKSTFLNILGLLDSSFLGDYRFIGQDVAKLNISQKNIIRNQSIGFVHQFFHLLPELNILENVALPSLINGVQSEEAFKRSQELLHNFGLDNRLYSKPSNLSGGEQQRVAIARSLINKPKLIIADEMTGNLDEKTANSIFSFFLDQIKINKQSLIYVTHNKKYSIQAKDEYEIIQQNLIKIS